MIASLPKNKRIKAQNNSAIVLRYFSFCECKALNKEPIHYHDIHTLVANKAEKQYVNATTQYATTNICAYLCAIDAAMER